MIFGAILAWHVPFVIWGIIEVPFFLCFAYSGIVVAMGYELSNDMAQRAQLARELEASDKRLNLAADSADLGLWEWDIARNQIWITDKGRALFGFGASEKVDFDRFRSRLHADAKTAARFRSKSVSVQFTRLKDCLCWLLLLTSVSGSRQKWKRRVSATRWRTYRA